MYGIDEIALQNRHDSWALLYGFMARGIASTCGRAGEGAVREAVRRIGRAEGERTLVAVIAAGIGNGADLAAAFTGPLRRDPDPRFRVLVLADDPERTLWEVHTCPYSDVWKRSGFRAEGLWYCEEYRHAAVAAYTGGKGQTNLSKCLCSGRDNHCRFSVYFRRANIAADDRAARFTKAAAKPVWDEDAILRERWTLTWRSLADAARERLGGEGACGVATGLRACADALARETRLHADATGAVPDLEFIRSNVALGDEEDAMYSANFRKPFFAALGLPDRA